MFFIPKEKSYYPEAYSKALNFYVCSKCFAYFCMESRFREHIDGCDFLPGKIIYEHAKNGEEYEFYEVDGGKQKIFCENLCLFAKIWIKSKCKTGIFEPEKFYFYLLAKKVGGDREIVGYFSKDRSFYTDSSTLENLAAIVVFQKGRGYGKWLVDLSRKLSIKQKKPGFPEEPFSKEFKRLYMK